MLRKIYWELLQIKNTVAAINRYIIEKQGIKEESIVKGSICQVREHKANGETVEMAITIRLDAEEWNKLRKQYFYHEMKAYIKHLEEEREK